MKYTSLHSCLHYVQIFLHAICLHVSAAAHKWFLHVASNVYLMWSGPVVCPALLHLIPVGVLGSSPLEGFILPANPEDLCHLRMSVGPSPQPCCGSFTRHGMCYSSHVVMSCQKQPWQMLLCCLWSDHIGLALQKPPLSSPIDCSSLAKIWLLWACSAIFQRQDVSSAKSKKCSISHDMTVLWKSWENNKNNASVIKGQTFRFITRQHCFFL